MALILAQAGPLANILFNEVAILIGLITLIGLLLPAKARAGSVLRRGSLGTAVRSAGGAGAVGHGDPARPGRDSKLAGSRSPSLSIGYAVLDSEYPFPSPRALVDAADQALYKAKELGRNRVAGYSESVWSSDKRAVNSE